MSLTSQVPVTEQRGNRDGLKEGECRNEQHNRKAALEKVKQPQEPNDKAPSLLLRIRAGQHNSDSFTNPVIVHLLPSSKAKNRQPGKVKSSARL